MNISKWTIIWKYLTGGQGAVLDYLLDIANNLVAKIETAKQGEIKVYLTQARTLLDTLTRYAWACPKKWRDAYEATLATFADVVDALEDLKLTPEEVTKICVSFKAAYASWRAD